MQVNGSAGHFPVMGKPNNFLNYFPVISGKYATYLKTELPALFGKTAKINVNACMIDTGVNLALLLGAFAYSPIMLGTFTESGLKGEMPSLGLRVATAFSMAAVAGACNFAKEYFGGLEGLENLKTHQLENFWKAYKVKVD